MNPPAPPPEAAAEPILCTVDVVLLTLNPRLQVALLPRDRAPLAGALALPGGFIHADEDADPLAAAARMLRAKTGLDCPYLEQLATFGGPERDPRGWSISVAHVALVPADLLARGAAGLRWHPVDALPALAFDHAQIVAQAVAYCQGLIRDPRNTIFVLISDLIEGGVEQRLLQRAAELVGSGVQCVALLALSDEGAPSYDRQIAAKLAGLGVPSFACTPDAFPGLMAAAIRREDVAGWAAQQGLVTSRA